MGLRGGGAVSEPTEAQKQLAADLNDLGLTNLGSRVLEGFISVERGLRHVQRELGVKERMLGRQSTHSTVDNEQRQRIYAWCEKAKFMLDHWDGRAEATP
jgi:hypothetical protein